VDLAELLDVLLYSLAAGLVVHQVSGNQQALTSLLLDHLLGVLGIGLLLGKIDDGHI
jgi:hypothetical protein